MAELTEKIRDYLTSATIKHVGLMDRLSEFLAVERGGKQLYQCALQQVRDADVLTHFQTFYEQTIKHEDVLTGVIRDLGGDPQFVSPTAKLAQAKAQALLDAMDRTEGLTPKQIEINAMESILLAETKDQADWELLGKIARQTTDSDLTGILKPAVEEVEPEEDEHLSWTKARIAELTLKALSE